LPFSRCAVVRHSSALAVPTVNDPSLTVTNSLNTSSPTTGVHRRGRYSGVAKNNGQVRRVLNRVLLGSPVLDLTSATIPSGDRSGSPCTEFSANHLVYLYFTESSTDGSPTFNRVVRYTWDGNNLANQEPIIDLPAAWPNHDGVILF
jgi:hypothetical protein